MRANAIALKVLPRDIIRNIEIFKFVVVKAEKCKTFGIFLNGSSNGESARAFYRIFCFRFLRTLTLNASRGAECV